MKSALSAFVSLFCLVFLASAPALAKDDALMIYTETAAFVKWISVMPDVELSEENMPRSFTGVVRNASKLNSYGLAVRMADPVTITVVAPYTWRVESADDSVTINAKGQIPFNLYPKL
ncbi:MAG: hypothetical protein V3573_10900 [Desulfovibrionaceae bacterium]